MPHPLGGFPFTRNRMAIAGILILGCSLALGVWYWEWGRPRSLDELDPNQIPAEDRFEGQPPELVAVLTTVIGVCLVGKYRIGRPDPGS